MNTEFMEFRDELATLSELDPELDYTPVHADEGFVSLDIYANHYIHHQNDVHSTIRFYLLSGEDTITSRCDAPSYIYHWDGKAWKCPAFEGHPDCTSTELARISLEKLRELYKHSESK